ncbi:MAG: bacterial transcriptional activator domain-containing protein [Bryobacteraceae bacterium]
MQQSHVIRRRIFLILPLLLAGIPASGFSQFLPSLQANTPEEFDAYLVLQRPQPPAQLLAGIAKFECDWPESELLAHVYEMKFEAYRTLGEVEGAIAAAGQALRAVPSNLAIMAAVALILGNSGSDLAAVDRASQYAERVLKSLETFRVPRSVPYEKWLRVRARLQSQAHAALGLAAFHRGRASEAAREFESAVALAPEPEPAHHYRLGKLYQAQDRIAEAREQFRRAASLGEPTIRGLAEAELHTLSPGK